jgi:polysaccharide biosynthesis/export protein
MSPLALSPSNAPTLLASATASQRAPRRSRAGFLASLAPVLLFCACTAPGMKLDMRPSSPESTVKVEGLKVTLRPLGAQVLKGTSAEAPETGALADLLVDKVPPYRVGSQDVLLVTVWDHPEITLPLGQYRTDSGSGMVVDEGGYLYFPYIGKLKVAGSTITQVRDDLAQQLAKVLQRPQVDVKVIAYRSQKVYVGGEVRNPAVHNVTDVPFTLAEAINRAGGFLPTADDSRILLTRGNRTWRLNFSALLASGNRIGQILLKDGDTLQVPNNQEDPVYLMGELVRPGTMPLVHGRLSLAQAISQAGGIQGATADARSIYVIRQGNAADAVDVFHLDARNPTTMVLADRFPLNPRDIVFVDAGTLVRWNRVVSLLLPTVSALTGTASDVKFLGQ